MLIKKLDFDIRSHSSDLLKLKLKVYFVLFI